MLTEEKIILLAEYFRFPLEVIREFLLPETPSEPKLHFIKFLILEQKRSEEGTFIDYSLLTREGRFMRLRDEISSTVDIREAAAYIDSVEPEVDDLEIIGDGNISTKQFYLIKYYCPPLYCGPTR